MFKLIGNENTKIYRRIRTWILAVILVVAIVLIAWAVKSHEKSDVNWKQNLAQTNIQMEQRLQQSSKHMPAISVQAIKETINQNKYEIQHNIDPNHGNVWTFATTAQNLSTLLVAFIVVIAGDVVASEFSSGTIKMLLTQTATRTKILVAKYLASLLFALFMTAVMFVASWLIGGIVFGFSGAGVPHVFQNAHNQVVQMSTASFLMMQYGFLLIQIVVTVTIAFMISTIFRSSALAITVSILAYMVGNILVRALSSYSWVKYILFAHTDLSQYVVGGPSIKGMTLGFSITTLIVYFVVMNILAWIFFVKRDVAYT